MVTFCAYRHQNMPHSYRLKPNLLSKFFSKTTSHPLAEQVIDFFCIIKIMYVLTNNIPGFVSRETT